MIDGWNKEDPPSTKKLPVEIDLPEAIANEGLKAGVSNLIVAVGQLVLIAFYFLLRIGEYTCKGTRNESKQTVQFRMKDITFFKKLNGRLRQLPRNAQDQDIMLADGVTLKLDNQKSGWKGVCIHQHANGNDYLCPVKATGRLYCRIRKGPGANGDTFISAYWDENGKRCDVTDANVRKALKNMGQILNYPEYKGIPIDRIDTHSLRGGGANALSLSGYSDTQIQKMGRWQSDTFKEYISDQLSAFSEGMSTAMSTRFNFVNIEGGVWTDVTDTILDHNNNNTTTAAA